MFGDLFGLLGRRRMCHDGNRMTRPTRFEHYRFLGDKRRQVVYDLDRPNLDPVVIEELVESGHGTTFGPDTLAEARNRNYRLAKAQRP